MKCINHPDIDTDVICSECYNPICENCRVTLAGKHYCRACLEKKVNAPRADEVSFGAKSLFLSFLLSLIPGVGYLYLGLMNRGLQAMLLFWGTIFVAELTRIDTLMPLIIPVIMFYTVFDTQQLARRMAEGFLVQDLPLVEWGSWSKRNTIGYGLIIIGGLALVNSFLPLLPPVFSYNIHRVVPGLLIMGLGIYILYRSARKEGGKDE